jgi:hypothetical protein
MKQYYFILCQIFLLYLACLKKQLARSLLILILDCTFSYQRLLVGS